MNFNKDLFDKTEAKEFGESERLALGGHEVIILSAEEYTSEVSGNTSLRVCLWKKTTYKTTQIFILRKLLL